MQIYVCCADRGADSAWENVRFSAVDEASIYMCSWQMAKPTYKMHLFFHALWGRKYVDFCVLDLDYNLRMC